MPTLDEWTEQVCSALNLDRNLVDQRAVLDLARDVAHGVARPAAPLTAYLFGLAVGSGIAPAQAAEVINGLIPATAVNEE